MNLRVQFTLVSFLLLLCGIIVYVALRETPTRAQFAPSASTGIDAEANVLQPPVDSVDSNRRVARAQTAPDGRKATKPEPLASSQPTDVFKSEPMPGGGTAEGRLQNGKREGTWKSYSKDGTLWEENEFHDGMLHGRSTMWDRSGAKLEESRYEKGQLVESEGWHANGERAFRCTYGTDGAPTHLITFDKAGRSESDLEYAGGKLDGRCVYWLASGSIDQARSGIYANGHRVSPLP